MISEKDLKASRRVQRERRKQNLKEARDAAQPEGAQPGRRADAVYDADELA